MMDSDGARGSLVGVWRLSSQWRCGKLGVVAVFFFFFSRLVRGRMGAVASLCSCGIQS